MKKTFSISCCILISWLMYSCTNKTDTTTKSKVSTSNKDSAIIKGEPCNITYSGLHFTKSINGADTLIDTTQKGSLKFRAGAKKDYFCDPNEQLSNNTSPILLTQIDNTKPFTLVSKVTPNFTEKGMYNAGVLFIYVNDNFWQKLCFEQSEMGEHRVVSVRTLGTSDDNNHDVVTKPFVYMKISSDSRTVASYYSTDKKVWHLVRLYKNYYPAQIWIGISTQCPVDTGCFAVFEELSLNLNNVKDFRLGN